MSIQEQSNRIYLDHNATSPLADGVMEAICLNLGKLGNPSSVHKEGRAARQSLERARRNIAGKFGADPHDLIFTSGGTESNHLGIVGLSRSISSQKKCVLISPTVHPSLRAAGNFLPNSLDLLEPVVNEKGQIDLANLAELLVQNEVGVVACSLVNHETGCIENMESIVELAKSHGALVFCDAVQGLGRLPIDVRTMGVHGLSISAHKIGGPKGVGGVWLQSGLNVEALIGGGKQENGRRPGTQASALIAGFSAAVDWVDERLSKVEAQQSLRNWLEEELKKYGAFLYSNNTGVCNTILARFDSIPGDLLVSSLDLEGIAISTGAACSSGAHLPSPVLLAMGLSEKQSMEAFRISFGPQTHRRELEELLTVLPGVLKRAKNFSIP